MLERKDRRGERKKGGKSKRKEKKEMKERLHADLSSDKIEGETEDPKQIHCYSLRA